MKDEEFISALGRAVPQFSIKPDWAQEGLLYPIVNDLARYVCSAASGGDWGAVKNSLSFLEETLGSPELRDLVDECLDTLLSRPAISKIKEGFGPALLQRWRATLEPRYVELRKWGHVS